MICSMPTGFGRSYKRIWPRAAQR